MKNRAKCKLCGDIIESLHRHDYVKCSCDEIAVDGGNDYFRASARNWENFLRLDDEGNEVLVTIREPDVTKPNIPESENVTKPNKEELIQMLDEMVKNIENLPPHAMTSSVTQYDLAALMMLISSIFKSDQDSSAYPI